MEMTKYRVPLHLERRMPLGDHALHGVARVRQNL